MKTNLIQQALAALVFLAAACSQGAGTNDTTIQPLLPETIVQGIPCLVALEIRNQPLFHRLTREEAERMDKESPENYQAYLNKLGNESIATDKVYPFQASALVSIQIISAANNQVVKTESGEIRPYSTQGMWMPDRSIFSPGFSGQFVFDIFYVFNGLTAGDYRVALTIHSGRSNSWASAPSHPFKLIALNEQQAARVVNVFPVLAPSQARTNSASRVLNESYWLSGVSNDITQAASLLPKEVADQMVAHLFAAKSAALGGVEKLPLEDLDRFPAHLRGLADLFRYEILYRQGKSEAAEKVWAEAKVQGRALQPDDLYYDARSTNTLNKGILERILRARR